MGVPTATEIKLSCCTAWEHPAARLLLGDHLHPGGTEMTEAAIEATDTRPGDVVLDVGCGNGSSLRLMRERGLRGIGIDLSEVALREASSSGSVLVADGEHLPLSPGSVEGAVVECVLSLLVDKAQALDDLRRVLKPKKRVAVSDVVVERELPSYLEGAAAWSSCIGGALSGQGYADLMARSGFEMIGVRDHSEALVGTIEKVRRRLSLFEISTALGRLRLEDMGMSSDLLERARDIAAGLIDEVRKGNLGYALLTAMKP